VVATEQVNLVWELHFQSHEQANGLERVVATVDVVTQEEVVVTFDVTVLVRDSPEIEESHQVLVLPVNVTEDFDWSVDTKHHWLLLKDSLALLSQGDNMLTTECKVTITIELSSPLSWSQQV